MRRHAKSVASALLIGAFLLAGCGGQSYKEVTRKSIVEVGLPANLLMNPGFESGRLNPWAAMWPRRARVKVTSAAAHSGKDSLRISLHRVAHDETVSISQSVALLPIRSGGTNYKMSMWVRTRALSKPVPISMRLGYGDGSYAFVTGDVGEPPVFIPKGSADWTELKITTAASETLSNVTVFPVDSPANFKGTLWIDDIALSVVD